MDHFPARSAKDAKFLREIGLFQGAARNAQGKQVKEREDGNADLRGRKVHDIYGGTIIQSGVFSYEINERK